jgi:hypothetical protein
MTDDDDDTAQKLSAGDATILTSSSSSSSSSNNKSTVQEGSALVVLSARLPLVPLTVHYRSGHQSLIAFSNELFYGGTLTSFPSAHDLTAPPVPSSLWQKNSLNHTSNSAKGGAADPPEENEDEEDGGGFGEDLGHGLVRVEVAEGKMESNFGRKEGFERAIRAAVNRHCPTSIYRTKQQRHRNHHQTKQKKQKHETSRPQERTGSEDDDEDNNALDYGGNGNAVDGKDSRPFSVLSEAGAAVAGGDEMDEQEEEEAVSVQYSSSPQGYVNLAQAEAVFLDVVKYMKSIAAGTLPSSSSAKRDSSSNHGSDDDNGDDNDNDDEMLPSSSSSSSSPSSSSSALSLGVITLNRPQRSLLHAFVHAARHRLGLVPLSQVKD